MNNKKYIELINKEIDKTISLNEKQKLSKYIKTNSEARAYYNDMLKTEALLDSIPEKNPSINLKKNILNSIDYNRYLSKKKQLNLTDYFSSMFAGTRTKIAASFAVGLVAGAAILLMIFNPSFYNNSTENNYVYGTMGLADAELIESIPINSADISGKIDISKSPDFYSFKVDLNSIQKYILTIEFDPANINMDNFSLNSPGNAKIEKGNGFIRVFGSDVLQYTLLFPAKKSFQEMFALKISRNKNNLFERKVHISAN